MPLFKQIELYNLLRLRKYDFFFFTIRNPEVVKIRQRSNKYGFPLVFRRNEKEYVTHS